jgi:hypothetical protein
MANTTVPPRNFICPETEEPCTNGACTRNICRLRQIKDKRGIWLQAQPAAPPPDRAAADPLPQSAFELVTGARPIFVI